MYDHSGWIKIERCHGGKKGLFNRTYYKPHDIDPGTPSLDTRLSYSYTKSYPGQEPMQAELVRATDM
jgi:hypothetical protein